MGTHTEDINLQDLFREETEGLTLESAVIEQINNNQVHFSLFLSFNSFKFQCLLGP